MLKRLRLTLLPMGVASGLTLFGLCALIFYPLGRDWTVYGIALVFSAGYGLWVRRRRRVTVLERHETDTELVWVVRITAKRRRAKTQDAVLQETLPAPPSLGVAEGGRDDDDKPPILGPTMPAPAVEPTSQLGGNEMTARRSPFPRPGESLHEEGRPSIGARAPATSPPLSVEPRSVSEPGTKVCPDCAETVLAAARVCRYCHYRFDAPDESASASKA